MVNWNTVERRQKHIWCLNNAWQKEKKKNPPNGRKQAEENKQTKKSVQEKSNKN